MNKRPSLINCFRDPETPARLAAAWRAGAVAAFATETVYGVGVSADVPGAPDRLRALKGRDAGKPFQRLVADVGAARRFTAPWTPVEERLALRCWPGPLTLILRQPEADNREPAAGSREPTTLGVRVPAYGPLLEALALLGGNGVWAASANAAGEPPWTDARDVAAWGGEALAMVAARPAGEDPGAGLASTVARVVGERVEALRVGSWSTEDLERIASRGAFT